MNPWFNGDAQTLDTFELAEQIAFGDGEISAPAANWLRVGLARFLRGEASLEVALRLTGMARKAKRNRELIRAARLLDDGRGLSDWELSGRLSNAIDHFDKVIRPRINRGAETDLSPVDKAIEAAYLSGACMTRSRYSLLLLLENK